MLLFVSLKARVDEMAAPFGGIAGLVRRARINRATLYAAFKREEELGTHSIDQTTAEALARASGRSVSWVLGEIGPVIDTLSMAQAAAANLVAGHLANTFEQAWLALREVKLDEPTVDGFTREGARRLIEASALEKATEKQRPLPAVSLPSKRARARSAKAK